MQYADGGSTVTLSSAGSSTEIIPPSGKLGFGSIDNALALAEEKPERPQKPEPPVRPGR